MTNSKVKRFLLHFRVTNSKLENKKSHFELLTEVEMPEVGASVQTFL